MFQPIFASEPRGQPVPPVSSAQKDNSGFTVNLGHLARQEILVSTGPLGPSGPTGPYGPVGTGGVMGWIGPTGRIGATGATGATGLRGVPGPPGG